MKRGARGVLLFGVAAGCATGAAPEPIGRSVALLDPPARRSREATAPSARPEEAPARPEEAPARPEEGPILSLPVPGFGAAVVSLPRAAAGPRPVLVATHGAGGLPESHCAVWRGVTNAAGYVLCPRGRALVASSASTGYYYPDHRALRAEVTAALSALEQRFGESVDLRAPIYAGFSQGATMGALVLPSHTARFAQVMLIEGGDGGAGEWTAATARRFAAGGGARVVLACGRVSCAENARRTRSLLVKANIEARVVYVEGAGHTYGGPMERSLFEAFSWFAEKDPRWTGRADEVEVPASR